ncbi:MAG: ATP-binding cassette domain-containing protein [Anaerolineae bacterium]
MLQVKGLTIIPADSKGAIVEDASFEVKEADIHALMGPNGSGKSSIAYAVMGLSAYRAQEGHIYFDGEEITHLPVTERARRGLTLAWQEPVRFEGITISEYIKAGLKDGDEMAVKAALELVGLDPASYAKRRVDASLSGGERKRVELAAVVAMRPKLMILDEPDSGLDIIVYDELYELLDQIRRETGAAILLISHREESGAVADAATLLWQGRVLKNGNFPEVMRAYCEAVGRRTRCRSKYCPTPS